MPLDLNMLVCLGDYRNINVPVLLHSDILPDASLLGGATRPTASSGRAGTRDGGHGALQLAPGRPAAGRTEEHGGDDCPDPRRSCVLDWGGDLVGLLPDHNLKRKILIFVLASSPYTYFGSAGGHP